MRTDSSKVLKKTIALILVAAILISGTASADQYRADEAYEILNNCRVTLLNCRDLYRRKGTLSDRTIELMYYTAKMLVASWNIAQIQEKDDEPSIIGNGADPDVLNEDQIDAKWESFLQGTLEKEVFIEDLIDYCWKLLNTKHGPVIGDEPEDEIQVEAKTEAESGAEGNKD